MIVPFQFLTQLFQLTRHLRHLLAELVDRFRCADACNDIFTLCIDEVFAVQLVFTSTGVARKCDARGRIIAPVAEDHRAHIDCRAIGHVGCDIELATVIDRTLAHP